MEDFSLDHPAGGAHGCFPESIMQLLGFHTKKKVSLVFLAPGSRIAYFSKILIFFFPFSYQALLNFTAEHGPLHVVVLFQTLDSQRSPSSSIAHHTSAFKLKELRSIFAVLFYLVPAHAAVFLVLINIGHNEKTENTKVKQTNKQKQLGLYSISQLEFDYGFQN